MDTMTHVHISKTGGTSVEIALGLTHRLLTAQELADADRKKWDAEFIFAFVRNPFDLIVSMWHYRIDTNQLSSHQPFTPWVLTCFGERDNDGSRYYQTQCDWLMVDGVFDIDFIGRFETLQTDFDELCGLLDLPCKTLPHAKRTTNRSAWQAYYTAETTAVVDQYFYDDFERWYG